MGETAHALRALGPARLTLGIICLPWTLTRELRDMRSYDPTRSSLKRSRELVLAHRFEASPTAPPWCGEWSRGKTFARLAGHDAVRLSCSCGFLDRVTLEIAYPEITPSAPAAELGENWSILDPRP